MLSAAKIWMPLGLLAVGVIASKEQYKEAAHDHYSHGAKDETTTTEIVAITTTVCPVVTSTTTLYHDSVILNTVTVTEVYQAIEVITKTTPTTTTVPVTTTVPTTVTVPTTTTISSTITNTVTTTLPPPSFGLGRRHIEAPKATTSTEIVTTVVERLTTQITTAVARVTTTDTNYVTVATTETASTTVTVITTFIVTSTQTATTTLTTVTTSTVYDPCPTYCSVYVDTVQVVYWPTDKPASYPATYVDPTIGYTFVSPSVYFLINTMYGTNSLGKVGPDTSRAIIPFNLDEVSTLVLPEQVVTRQLSLSDLGTDCPHTLPSSVLATKSPEPHCDPILAAPLKIRKWAWPCNACGRFGLFDPPYAIPTITGGLLPTTTVVVVPTTTTPAPVATPTAPPADSTITTTITQGNSRIILAETFRGTSLIGSSTIAVEAITTASPVVPPVTTTSSAPTTSSVVPVPTAAASRVTGGTLCVLLSMLASVILL